MNHLFTAVRILVGLLFLLGGLNGFYTFMPVPEFHPFMKILVESGYLYVVKALEVMGAVLLLANRRIALALTLLTPVAVNIGLYHLLLDGRNALGGVLVVIGIPLLLWRHRESFNKLLAGRAK